MENAKHLLQLGEEAINMEIVYLELKMEKILTGAGFTKDKQLAEAERQWKEITGEYYSFLEYIQSHPGMAA